VARKKASNKEISYEEAVSRLEDIIASLESKDSSLDSSLELFEEGIGLYRVCKQKLEEADKKITKIISHEDGYKEVDFTATGED
jgi:exodeoxyribonuclease VII small subunit